MEGCCNLVPFPSNYIKGGSTQPPNDSLPAFSVARFTQRPLETSGTPWVLGYLGRRSCLENIPRLLACKNGCSSFATFKSQDSWHHEKTPEMKFIETIPNKTSGFPNNCGEEVVTKKWWRYWRCLSCPWQFQSPLVMNGGYQSLNRYHIHGLTNNLTV